MTLLFLTFPRWQKDAVLINFSEIVDVCITACKFFFNPVFWCNMYRVPRSVHVHVIDRDISRVCVLGSDLALALGLGLERWKYFGLRISFSQGKVSRNATILYKSLITTFTPCFANDCINNLREHFYRPGK